MTQLQDFWTLVQDVWQTSFLGVDVGKALTAFLIFLGFLVLRRLIATVIVNRLMAMARRTATNLDVEVVEALQGPIGLVPVTLGAFLALNHLDLQGNWALGAENLVRSLIILTIFWALHNSITPLSALLYKLEHVLSQELVVWLIKAVKVIVILIGAAAVLETWGVQVGPILAGMGLFGVAVALGAQDLFKNLIAGILILAEKRFRNGDWIKVDGVVEGTVENIGFRSTLVRRFDKAPVYVPNAKLSDDAVTNFTAMTHRRIYWKIGVEYRTTTEQLRQIRDGIDAYLTENDAFAGPPDVVRFVRIDSFNDSSIDIMVYCFTKTTVWGEWLEVKEELAYTIKQIVEGAGTGFAFPSQSLYVETMPGEAPEVFTPPPEKPKPKPIHKPKAAPKRPRKKPAPKQPTIGATDSADAGEGS